MGNFDKWSTPKQIKIERKGEPRPLRRGVLKKGERRKGRKARLDEVLAAGKIWELCKLWYENGALEAGDTWWNRHHKKRMEKAKDKYEKLRDAFRQDYGYCD